MPLPSGVKLRDSCHTCASSKVKCSKDKPICARCAERGISCEYLVTQRTGRKARRRSSTATSSSSRRAPLLPNMSPKSPRLDSLSVDGISFLDSPLPKLDDSGLDDFITSLSVAPAFTLPNQEFLSQQNTTLEFTPQDFSFSNPAIGLADLPLPSRESSMSSQTDSSPDCFDFPLGGPLGPFASNQPTQTSAATSISGSSSPEPACLDVALQLMASLSAQDSPHTSSLNQIGSFPPQSDKIQSTETIIAKNKQVIDTINQILQSSSIQDGYCLVVINLIVSRVLNRYASAARQHPFDTQDNHNILNNIPTPINTSTKWSMGAGGVSSDPLQNQKINPKTAQRVLSELYQVEGLIDKLSSSMQLCTKRSEILSNGGGFSSSDSGAAAPVASPFSTAVLGQLDTELRKRLSTVSLELIDGLRQYWG